MIEMQQFLYKNFKFQKIEIRSIKMLKTIQLPPHLFNNILSNPVWNYLDTSARKTENTNVLKN